MANSDDKTNFSGKPYAFLILAIPETEKKAKYDDWAPRYDEDLECDGVSWWRVATSMLLTIVKEEHPSKREAVIVDAGCGTG